jgi:hypothetical protein
MPGIQLLSITEANFGISLPAALVHIKAATIIYYYTLVVNCRAFSSGCTHLFATVLYQRFAV